MNYLIKKSCYNLYYFYLQCRFQLDRTHRIIGPICGDKLNNSDYQEIIKLRNFRYQSTAAHLLSLKEEKIDLSELTFHFFIKDQNEKICACVRFIKFPFDFSSNLPFKLDWNKFDKYLEISRLVVAVDHKKLALKLLSFSGLYFIKEGVYQGFMAQCSPSRTKIFRKMGMDSLAPEYEKFNIEDRVYNLMIGSFTQITQVFIKRMIDDVKDKILIKGEKLWEQKS